MFIIVARDLSLDERLDYVEAQDNTFKTCYTFAVAYNF